MRILLGNHSSYPSGEGEEPRGAPRATSPSTLARIIRQQEDVGLEIVTDGQPAILPWMQSLSGIRFPSGFDALAPWPARTRPVVESKPQQRAPLLAAAWHDASQLTRCTVKAAILGPYSLARLCDIQAIGYAGWHRLAVDLAAILAEDLRRLSAAGAPLIQLEEPLILAHPEDVRTLRELLDPVYAAASGTTQVALVTYGADAGALFAQLNSAPCDILGVEIVGSPGTLQTIEETGSAKMLALGIVGAEPAADADALARFVERALHRYVHDAIYLQPAVGLGTLSLEEARGRLRALAATRARVTVR